MKAFIASHLRDMNRRTVYKLLSSVEEISKAEISRQTGISAPTIIKIIDFFQKIGLVEEAGAGDSALGRKPQLLRLNPEAAFAIGIEYEGDRLSLGIVDLLGNIKFLKRMSVEPDFNKVIRDCLMECIQSSTAEAEIPMSKVLGVGIGIPGVVDSESFVVEYAPLVGISERADYSHSVQSLSKELGIQFFFENDVNAAAVGEFSSRGLSENDDLLYLSLGSGLGAGIILDGKLRKGRRYSAGEIGYMVFDENYTTSKSKAGWMESKIVLDPVYKRIISSSAEEVNSNFVMTEEQMSTLAENIASVLGLCIANLSTVLDTELVVLGGIGLEVLGQELLTKVKSRVTRLGLHDIECQLNRCRYPGIVGAANIVTEAMLDTLLED